MSDRLRPCPFCGGDAAVEEIDRDGRASFSVGCTRDDDGACMGYQSLTTFALRSEAIAAWNRRTPPSDIAAEDVAQLRQMAENLMGARSGRLRRERATLVRVIEALEARKL